MNRRKLARKLRLRDEDFAAIKSAVAEAEGRSSGEIAIAAIGESSNYSFYELLAAVILGAVAFAVLLPFYGDVAALLDRLSWYLPPWGVSAFYGIASFAVIAVFFLIANIPAIDRLVVPRRARSRMVYARALRHFAESGVYATREHTGILIFISYMEREVRILADTGISSKVEQAEWDRVARELAAGIKADKAGSALIQAVKACGDLLASRFPARKENPDELPDGLALLEAGE
jgi:putative membrane protein